MATDTAHIKFELASGRNEVTAPFRQTSQRRRSQPEEPALKADAPELSSPPRVIIDVPLGRAAKPRVQFSSADSIRAPSGARPTWITFIAGTAAVAAAVWWVMFQRIPDIDPRDVIQRNLIDARGAMAEGRYTDPPERSAFHYFTTVLALDPDNADALAGIDAIADRHLTDARVLLEGQRIAEAGVAVERARRVKPGHSSLPELDTQLRAELKKLFAASVVQPAPLVPTKPKLAKVPRPVQGGAEPGSGSENAALNIPAPRPLPTANPPATNDASTPSDAKAPAVLALAPIETEQTSLIRPALEPASGSTPVIEEPAATVESPASLAEQAPDTIVPTGAPKLVNMVQPEYPQEALMRGIEGWVEVSLQVNAAGDVVAPRVEATSRGRLFNRAALEAVRQWKYEPRPNVDTAERLYIRLQFRHAK